MTEDVCTHGELRLQDGPNVRAGRLELCVNNVWGTVCANTFDEGDAALACATMNFERQGMEI